MTFIIPTDFLIEVGKGGTPDKNFHVFGQNLLIGTTAEDLWDVGGLWVAPTQDRTHDLVSTDAVDAGTLQDSGTATGGSKTTLVDTGGNFVVDGVTVGDLLINDTTLEHGIITAVTATQLDVEGMNREGTNASGNTYRIVTAASTGATTVLISSGLDSLWDEKREYIILNGITNVPTTRTYQRINRIVVPHAGSGEANAGDITLTAQTDLTITIQISIGNNISHSAIYTTPNGKAALLLGVYGSIAKKQSAAGQILIFVRLVGEPWIHGHLIGVVAAGTSTFERPFKAIFRLPPKTDFRLNGVSDTINTAFAGGFEILLVDS